MSVAIITGASRGLGRALATGLAERGWRLVLDARGPAGLERAAAKIAGSVPIAGDVTDPEHRRKLVRAADSLGGLDLLVNNASELGPSPLPSLQALPSDAMRRIYESDVFAPFELLQLALPTLSERQGVVVNVSSDAGVEAYPGWGGYGSAKAALDQLTAVIAVEEPSIRAYAVDPGDMRTEMHQAAFPGEDISDRPEPESIVPAFLRLLEQRPPSGRYRAADFLPAAVG